MPARRKTRLSRRFGLTCQHGTQQKMQRQQPECNRQDQPQPGQPDRLSRLVPPIVLPVGPRGTSEQRTDEGRSQVEGNRSQSVPAWARCKVGRIEMQMAPGGDSEGGTG